MTIVYGGCVEPGGMELDDDSYEVECPECKSPDARKRRWEALDGGCINVYERINCPACGHRESDALDVSDEYCSTEFPDFDEEF